MQTTLISTDEAADREALIARGVPEHTAIIVARRFAVMNEPFNCTEEI